MVAQSLLYAPARAGGPWATPALVITGGDDGYPAVPDLHRPLPGIDSGAARRLGAVRAVLRGVYTFAWDLTGYLIPTGDDAGVLVRTQLFVLGREARQTIPCVDALGARVARVSRPAAVTWTGGATQSVTILAPLQVLAVRGEVRVWTGENPSLQDLAGNAWTVMDADETSVGLVARAQPAALP